MNTRIIFINGILLFSLMFGWITGLTRNQVLANEFFEGYVASNQPEEYYSALSPQVSKLFEDDFEGGTSNWNLDSNWKVVSEGANHVLEGSSHAWASQIGGYNWGDYEYSVDVKMIAGAVQLNFRMSDIHGRYLLGITPGGMYLRRESPWEKFSGDLATDITPFSYNTWNNIRIKVSVGEIWVYVNNNQRIYYHDTFGTALWQGNIGLETVGSGNPQARFDNVLVEGVSVPEKSWVKTGGPIGGLGYDVRYGGLNKNILYVTDNYSGVNKSQNGGKSWFATNRGIDGRFGSSGDAVPVFTLTVDPNNSDILWAGLKDAKGAYKSINGGQTWKNVTPPISEAQFVFRGFTIQKGNSNIVYAQGELPMNKQGKAFDMVMGRIYRTADGGSNWEKIWEGENLVRYVIIHPNNPNLLYASLGIFDREANDSACTNIPPDQGTGGVLRLEKKASGWDARFLDSNEGLTDHYVGSLVMHPSNSNIMLAGAGNNACSRWIVNQKVHNTGGVFRTVNGGNNWVKTLDNEIITSVEFAPSNPNIAYAGGQNHFYISTDGGIKWTMVAGAGFPWGPSGLLAGFPIDILVDPDNANTLFVNNYGGGNVKSIDGGKNWELASQGYTGALMLGIDVDPFDSSKVFGTARSGAFRSFSGGSEWHGIAFPPASLGSAYAVEINPADQNIVITSDELLGTIYRSQDSGSTWINVYTIPDVVPGEYAEEFGMRRIEFALPPHENVVYAGSCRGSVPLTAGEFDGKGIFKSTDTGKSWFRANGNKIDHLCIADLTIHPTDPSVVYIATPGNGVYKTENGGANWDHLPNAPTDARSLAIHPINPKIIFLGTENQGVYKSDNAGSTWNQSVPGMEPNDFITDIVFDPSNPDITWVSSWRSGIYRWIPSENRWAHVNNGLRTRSVERLVISSDGSVLYAATSGEGVFRLGTPPLWKISFPYVKR